jgi:hypothetical protein
MAAANDQIKGRRDWTAGSPARCAVPNEKKKSLPKMSRNVTVTLSSS